MADQCDVTKKCIMRVPEVPTVWGNQIALSIRTEGCPAALKYLCAYYILMRYSVAHGLGKGNHIRPCSHSLMSPCFLLQTPRSTPETKVGKTARQMRVIY